MIKVCSTNVWYSKWAEFYGSLVLNGMVGGTEIEWNKDERKTHILFLVV